MVLIDGSEFTGFAELQLIDGANFILLDDICTFKNWKSFRQLRSDSRYQLMVYQPALRNGFAVFRKKSG